MVYPDGGSLLDQPILLLDAFAVIGDQMARIKAASSAAG